MVQVDPETTKKILSVSSRGGSDLSDSDMGSSFRADLIPPE